MSANSGSAARGLTVAVNMSMRQLEHGSVVADVMEALENAGLPPNRLVVEITESQLVADTDLATERLRALREIGVHAAIDDFGTGYSSLAYLRGLPLDTLKVDRSFVSGLGLDGREATVDLPIVQAVVSLAHSLGISVVAEGIEGPGQLACLRDLDCDRGQGYHFARPLDPSAVLQLLADSSPLSPAAVVEP